eukprot:2016776-Amphidinium_carterae.1
MFVDDGHIRGEGLPVLDYVFLDFFNCMFENDGHVFGEWVAVFDYVHFDRFGYFMFAVVGDGFDVSISAIDHVLLADLAPSVSIPGDGGV